MQAIMGEYSVLNSEVCHTAQERLRKEMGIMEENDPTSCITIWHADDYD